VRLLIIGGSGHSRVVLDAARLAGVERAVVVESATDGRDALAQSAAHASGTDLTHFVVAIGDNNTRARIFGGLLGGPLAPATIVHPAAVIAADAVLGQGTVVFAGVVVNPGARVGDDCVLNTGCTVDHDCVIGDHAHIAPGVSLCGGVSVGARSLIGVGACVAPGASVGSDCIIGAGATVVSDIADHSLAHGTPARVARTLGGADLL
jgi:sugar O-acyltransferase (sialic acid O-acetyltransferase NeuD family)